MSFKLKLQVGNLPSNKMALTNKVYVSTSIMAQMDDLLQQKGVASIGTKTTCHLILVNGHPYAVEGHDQIPDDSIALNGLHRRFAKLSIGQAVTITGIDPPALPLATLTLTVDTLAKKAVDPKRQLEVDTARLAQTVLLVLENQVLEKGQSIALDFEGTKFEIAAFRMQALDLRKKKKKAGEESKQEEVNMGQLLEPTQLTFSLAEGSRGLALEGDFVADGGAGSAQSIFLNDFDFEKLGIGGLDAEFNQIFRRAFASRLWPPSVIKQMGINHVRGMLLFGPPGCGKTLIARQIGKALNAREPKIVNGPEILDKFVGGSEEKIRELFKEAEQEQAERADKSMLHIIILDEMDAICKARGTVRDGTGVQDSVVNQLLSKIDGVDSLNNILLIGMTNRKDMIDDALLRPGRLEVHVEIGLPDTKGRLQILNIHTRNMRESKRLAPDVPPRLPEIAEKTKNFSGAEIEGLVKAASSFALERCIDHKDLGKAPDTKKLVLQYNDLIRALDDVEPKFGAKSQELKAFYRNGFVNYGESFDSLYASLQRLVDQVRVSTKTPLLSVLLHGPSATGKTALAAKLSVDSGFPFVRMISADEMIGHSDVSKSQMIHKVFMDSYKSPLSLILIDDIERIIDYVPIGPRFSNTVLQTLLVLLKKIPPDENRRLLVIGTTSVPRNLEDLGITDSFSVSQPVPLLEEPAAIAKVLKKSANMDSATASSIAKKLHKPIGVKQLLMVAEMAQQGSEEGGAVDPSLFMECLHTAGF
eukprot:CAMPEP_0172448666 /NCGR_PEP_ID=MMETSP1065-20121228/7629_1 /TAXON_ID=265537 /ORGANISM="Amphiprora paludosa, Strain CCMP125" /LENGTH=758 /DNA_ID=CAMNT_0013200223 /DNA_START=22 /DNA_END=2298 /DNA_ORIENTATION=+